MSKEPPVKVLYIIGWGRSGSTLIDNLLGEIDGFFSTGELRNLWHEGLQENRKCGCGELVIHCPVWSSVLRKVFGSNRREEIYFGRILEWQRATLRTRSTWRILRTMAGPRIELEAYAKVMARIYNSVAEVTNARVIVDSSKVPSDAALLTSIPSVDPFFLHLVRDPRATAYSWQRRKARLDGRLVENMPRFGLTKNAGSWMGFNLGAEALKKRAHPERFMRLRYEDFASEPRTAIERIAAFTGCPTSRTPFSDVRTAKLGVNHTISGNPSRFRTGPVVVSGDDEWISRQPVKARWATTLISLPYLGRYEYPILPNRGRPRSH